MTRDDPSAFAPPPAFGPFRVLHQIGIGVLGPVFRTYEPGRDRLVAVKVFRLDITPEQAQALADELASAADAGLFHPSIVEPIAAGVEGTVAYRAEEYVAGESMDVAIRHYAPAPLDKALPFITQLAGAIDFARAAGVGHGALHLRDIFLTPDEARASGFGVVDAFDRLGLRAPVRRPYTAPERIAGERWSTPADVFSLAAIAYELLTGRRPAGTGEQIGALSAESAGEHAATIRSVLARAMDDDPARRYQSALGFASALEAAARGEHVTDALRDVSAIAAAAPFAAEPLLHEAPAPAPQTAELAPFPPELTTREEAVSVVSEQMADEVSPAEASAGAAERDADAWDGPEEPAFISAPHRDLGAEQGEEEAEAAAIEMERDEDEAHYELLQREQAASDEPTLFDEEAVEDLAIEQPASHRFTEEFAPQREEQDFRSPVHQERAGSDMRDAPLAGVAAGHARPDLLPRAMILILGLLLGFAAGYFVRGRDAGQVTQPAPAASAEQARGGLQAQPAPPPAGQEFSEEAVARPPATATPPAEAPAVPPDVPPAGSTGSPARPEPATAKPAAAAATTGTIVVRSTPSRAGVTVNGSWRGRTPLTLAGVRFGDYTIRIVQPGYAVAREEFTLSPTDPNRTLSFRLQRSSAAADAAAPRTTRERTTPPPSPERGAAYSGVIYVDSRPRGAAILIDGRRVGTTPARIPDVAIGSHVVRLELAEHRPWTASTRVAAGQETRVTGSLERIQ